MEAKEQPEEAVENEGEKEVVIEVLDEDTESDEGEVPVNRRRNLRDTGDSSEEDNSRKVQSGKLVFSMYYLTHNTLNNLNPEQCF